MASDSRIADVLKAEAEQHPELVETIDLYSRLLEIQEQAQIPAYEPTISEDEARARLQQGEPLLKPEELNVDADRLTDLAMQIAFAIAEQRRDRVRELADVHAWLHRRRDRMSAIAEAYLRTGRVPESNSGVNLGLLTFVIHNALHPFLRARAQALEGFVDASAWYRKRCPVCGGEPDVAALEKRNGRRRLICSRCDTEWVYRRLGCPFCGNEDPKELAFFPSEDRAYRLAVCERCRRYLKTVDFREMAEERPLAAERVLTAGMDVAAQEAGYQAQT
jgi:FdhE protein